MKSNCIVCGKPDTYGLCRECTKAANDRVVYTHIDVPAKLFDPWKELYSGDSLTENKARGVIIYQAKTYVVFGMAGGILETHEIIDAKLWKDKTYNYHECIQYNVGGGPFFANYLKFKCNSVSWVVIPDRVTVFHRVEEPEFKQLSMF